MPDHAAAAANPFAAVDAAAAAVATVAAADDDDAAVAAINTTGNDAAAVPTATAAIDPILQPLHQVTPTLGTALVKKGDQGDDNTNTTHFA